jgi:hypothetical protein
MNNPASKPSGSQAGGHRRMPWKLFTLFAMLAVLAIDTGE